MKTARAMFRRAVLPLLLTAILAFPAAGAQKKGKANEKDPQYQYEKGVVALRYGLTDEAIRYGELAVSLDPNHYGGHSLLGNAYFKKGEFSKAVGSFERAAALKPDLAEAQANLGLAYYEVGDLEKAETALAKAASGKPDAVVCFNLARVYLKLEKYEDALAEVQKSIRLDGRSPGAYNLKGVVLNQLSRYREAAGSFEAGLVLSPEDVNLRINLGISYANANQPDKARAAFEKVIPSIEDPALKAKVEGYLKSLKEPGRP